MNAGSNLEHESRRGPPTSTTHILDNGRVVNVELRRAYSAAAAPAAVREGSVPWSSEVYTSFYCLFYCLYTVLLTVFKLVPAPSDIMSAAPILKKSSNRLSSLNCLCVSP